MRRFRILFLVSFSVFLHFILYLGLFQNHPLLQEKSAVSIEIVEKPTTPITRSNPTRSHPNNIGLKNRKLVPNVYSPDDGLNAEKTFRSDVGSTWGTGSSSASVFGKHLKNMGLFQRLFRDLDGLVYYPGILASHNQQGTVTARIVLSQSGECVWPDTQISSTNRHLQIYVLDTLKKLCRQKYSIPENSKFTIADMSFTFEITERDDKEWRDQKNFIVGNVLNFYRNSHQSIAEWRIGPFTGMFPIPAVKVDFDWLKEHWDKYVEKLDPMDEFRDK